MVVKKKEMNENGGARVSCKLGAGTLVRRSGLRELESILGGVLQDLEQWRSSLDPGALCMMQRAGHTELVLCIGKGLIREKLPKSFKQHALAMALAYVDMSRDGMALSLPDFMRGCEVLERTGIFPGFQELRS